MDMYSIYDQWCSPFIMIMPTSPAEQAAHVSNLEASYVDEQHDMLANNVNACSLQCRAFSELHDHTFNC